MSRIRVHIEITGIVQGVGFRPYMHRAVREHSLSGWVRNTSNGAEMELEGEQEQIEALIAALKSDPPGLAFIEAVKTTRMEDLYGFYGFEIRPSRTYARRNTLISPDIATCGDCLRELYDKKDRRFGYPFINCTNCGPRFTIIRDVPYDRKNTTMSSFPMCEQCAGEYADITNRRYHAQPDCCKACGPALFFMENGVRKEDDCIRRTADAIKAGRIAAVKGLGGFHLASLADDPEVLRKLRVRKRRDRRPFALMCRDAEAARRLAYVSEAEEALLTGKERPIVLLKKKPGMVLPEISENPYVGIMLPYTPVHHLLFDQGFDALVMTSANLSELPIIYQNEEALRELDGIADVFLMHDREIMTRCDDSVLFENGGKPYFIRRSRGYVPLPDAFPAKEAKILACGAEQKASFALYGGGHLFRSQHIGDLKNLETLGFYEEQIANFENLFDIEPEVLVCDLHPDYLSTRYAEQRAEREGKKLLRIQHHYAHMASCMADNRLTEPCIGIIWDGTGYGTDRTIWGGEFLYGDLAGFERKGSILPIPLPGSDKCMEELERVAVSLAYAAGKPYDCAGLEIYRKMIEQNINCPASSGMGRLFDGVSALLSLCGTAGYEGEGAVLLEAAAQAYEEERLQNNIETETDGPYPFTVLSEDIYRFDWREMIAEILRVAGSEEDRGRAARRFHLTLIDMAVQICRRIREDTGCGTVVLSGGTFQNRILLKRLPGALEKEGFSVYTHSQITTNDEGISAGQAAVALARGE